MDVALITASIQGLVFAKDVLDGHINLKVNTESRKLINNAARKVSEAHDVIYLLREELFKIQEENKTLKEKVREGKDWDKEFDGYKLVETQGGATVYGSTFGPPHFVCPSCIQFKQLHILQDKKVLSGIFGCPNCNAIFPVNKTG